MLQSDRGITYATTVPEDRVSSRANGGAPDYDGPPLVSFEKRIADGLASSSAITITVNVLGRNITARITNLRERPLGKPRHQFRAGILAQRFPGAPHTDLATLTYPGGGSLAEETAVLETVERGVSGGDRGSGEGRDRGGRRHRPQSRAGDPRRQRVTLVAAVLVLGGALAAGHRYRVYDAVISRRSARRAAG